VDIFHSNILNTIRLVKGGRFAFFKKSLFARGATKILCHHFLFFHSHIRSGRIGASWPENPQDRNPDHCRKMHHPAVIANEQSAFS